MHCIHTHRRHMTLHQTLVPRISIVRKGDSKSDKNYLHFVHAGKHALNIQALNSYQILGEKSQCPPVNMFSPFCPQYE